MDDEAAAAARFVHVVGWVFLIAAAVGLLASAAHLAFLFQVAPPVGVAARARAIAFGLLALSLMVVVVSMAFLRRRPWARGALAVLAGLGLIASLAGLVTPSEPIEPPPAGAPAEYVRLLRVISIAHIAVPLVLAVLLGWILWRLRSSTVRDQFL